MEFIQINSAEDYRVQEIFDAYCKTFPENERRDWNKLCPLFSHPKAKIISVLYNAKNIGYLMVWELSNFTFVEHFEVFEEFRNQKLGSVIIRYLFENHPRIILEIEHGHLNEETQRRYSFYRRNGFSLIDEMYVQPSYGQGKDPMELWLLANYIPENLKEVKDEIYDIVYH